MRGALMAALTCMSLPVAAASEETGHTMQTGEGLMRMCFGAITVKSLSIMCHNYINGYLDAVATGRHSGKPCFGKDGAVRLPPMAIIWLKKHPEYLQRPAPEVLDRVIGENFACKT